jgi:hypothetical protein
MLRRVALIRTDKMEGHVAFMMEKKNMYRLLVGKPEGRI